MKKTIFMITATALLLTACGNNAKPAGDAANTEDSQATTQEAAPEPAAEASIVGVWKLSDIDLGMEAPKGKEKMLEDMKAKMIAETVYTFNDDGTMSFKNPMVKETPATYTYEDSKITITDNKTKKAETVAVESLTADKLVLSSEQRGKKAVMTFSK
jgi:hypothetical protein